METIATTMVLTGANSCAIIIPRAMETIVIEVKKEGRFGLSLAVWIGPRRPTPCDARSRWLYASRLGCLTTPQ